MPDEDIDVNVVPSVTILITDADTVVTDDLGADRAVGETAVISFNRAKILVALGRAELVEDEGGA